MDDRPPNARDREAGSGRDEERDELALEETIDSGSQPTVSGRPAARGGGASWLPTDKFEMIGELGRGAMGVVYAVRHRALDKRMAVKRMAQSGLAPRELARFRREARAANDIEHPNIVRVVDLDSADDGTPYIVMEMLEGRDLKAVLRKEGLLPLDRTIALVRGVASALDAAHARGVIHRDLKPGNLFVAPDDTVKILDFGVCHQLGSGDDLTRPGVAIGTPAYMAPEQIRGDLPEAASDIYALAAIVYEMLTGRIPFAGRLPAVLANRGDALTPERVEKLNPDVSASVARAVEWGLAFQPGDRPASATAFVDALESTRNGETVAVPALRRRRRRIAIGLWGTLALTALLGVGWGLLGPTDGSAPGPRPVTAPLVEGPLAWPAVPRLLVLPFRHEAERELDRDLWPLFDRFVVNALAVDERVRGSLVRVDPAAVAREMELREIRAPVGDAEARELAVALGADVLLDGTLHREAGLLRVAGRLTLVTGPGEARFAVSGVRLKDVARSVGDAVRSTLRPEGPPAPPADRAAQLLVTRPESVTALLELDGYTPLGEAHALMDRILAADDGAVGVAWERYLANVSNPAYGAALAAYAPRVADPELRRFLQATGRRGDATDACDGLDADALGARYPLVIGPLAGAVCGYLRGEWDEALQAALRAFDQLPLRTSAGTLVTKLQYFARTCEDLLPVRRRLHELQPERPEGWSGLANWYARCDRPDEARRVLRITRALLGDDPPTNTRTGYHGAWVHLAALDVEGARPWLALVERFRRRDDPRSKYYFVSSLALYMQGRFQMGLEQVRAGMAALKGRKDDFHTMLVASYFYMVLGLGDLDEAQRTAAGFAVDYDDPTDHGNRYMGALLSLAVARARGEVDDAVLEQELQRLGEEVERRLGALGRTEREAQECLLLSHLATAERAERHLFAAAPTNKQLGGCRFRHAQRLLEAQRYAEAAAQFQRALSDIIWARFLYADFIAPAMLGRARALEGAGDETAAGEMYERIVQNFSRADRSLPEIAPAREALARLAETRRDE